MKKLSTVGLQYPPLVQSSEAQARYSWSEPIAASSAILSYLKWLVRPLGRASNLLCKDIRRSPGLHILELEVLVALWAANSVPHTVVELVSDGLRQAADACADIVLALRGGIAFGCCEGDQWFITDSADSIQCWETT